MPKILYLCKFEYPVLIYSGVLAIICASGCAALQLPIISIWPHLAYSENHTMKKERKKA